MAAMDAEIAAGKVENFYYLSRISLVKDERYLDRFDQVFGRVFKGLEVISDKDSFAVPEEWLRKISEKFLSPEEKAKIAALGGWEKIMEELKKRLEEQKKRHQGGSKWIGTGGTSPFGAYGYNPAGIRIGQKESRHRRAIKVWDKREFKDLDDSVELGTRNIKIALRRLRKFARQGAADELDLDGTIKGTANKGYLDIKMVPERRNTIKVLLFFDVGGSMDDHVRICEELFSAARSQFKHMEYFYFHNCLYEGVWKNNSRRHTERINTYYKVIFIGDAAMSPYEISYPGGSVEHMNPEPGAVWLQRLTNAYAHAIWLNPTPEKYWSYTPSTDMIQQLFTNRMYPLTLEGLDNAMRELVR